MNKNIKRCYFCEVPHEYPSFFMEYVNEIYICCETALSCEFMIDKLNTIKDNIECPICYTIKKTIELPTCTHRVCLKCCKTIYFGTSDNNIPVHPNEIDLTIGEPKWPYDIIDDDYDNDEKLNKFYRFEDTHYFNYENISYEKLLEIRNDLIEDEDREEWMNSEEFINYENKLFKYKIDYQKAEKEWEEYSNSKRIGNKICPLCRKQPCNWL